MGLFGIFSSKKSQSGEPPLKKKIKTMKCRRISYVDTDLAELEADIRSDSKAILKLTPVNYYAVKNQYVMAHIYTSIDYSENYVQFTRIDFERRTGETDIYPIDFETLSKALAKVGIIITRPDNDDTDK